MTRRSARPKATTTAAAREIELSTMQQTTAVEQVNVAIANTAQATKETEASSGQTFRTASQLAGLSTTDMTEFSTTQIQALATTQLAALSAAAVSRGVPLATVLETLNGRRG